MFDWEFQQSDFNFNSGLTGFIKELYAAREKEFGCEGDHGFCSRENHFVSRQDQSFNVVCMFQGVGECC